MPRLRVDGREVEVPAGANLLAAAAAAGVEVPTMCFLPGREEHASCMVCVVEDEHTGRLLPACATPAVAGARIRTDSEPVREARREALELLLGEHLGDCEALCEVVCPARLPVPRVLRRLRAGDVPAAAVLAAAGGAAPCVGCPAPCERACRRGRVDEAVAIRAAIIAACSRVRSDGGMETSQDAVANYGRAKEKPVSRFGPVREEDKQVFMLEAAAWGRVLTAPGRLAPAAELLAKEAARCLHCDCRKVDSCLLRAYARRYGARQDRFPAGSRQPFSKLIGSEVVYEPGKCVLCGRCVRITAARGVEPGLAFIGRGSRTTVGVPLGGDLDAGLGAAADECVRSCPTGALAWKRD